MEYNCEQREILLSLAQTEMKKEESRKALQEVSPVELTCSVEDYSIALVGCCFDKSCREMMRLSSG